MFTGSLMAFQEPMVKRMVERRKMLLAAEMGLGKTVISIAAVEQLYEDGEINSGLVIVPSSVKWQWARQIEKFTDDAIVMVIEGTPAQRQHMYSTALSSEYQYIILNYEQVVNDWPFVSKLPRDYVIIDEAVAIKSFRAKRSRRIKKLDAPFKWALTGQPVENRPEEVYSIMQFVDEDVLGRFDMFDRTFVVRNSFGGVKYYKNLPTLHRALSDAMVRKRRDDPDVAEQMPRVVTEEILVEFDRPGKVLYRKMANDLLIALADAMAKYGSFDLWRHYSPTAGTNQAEAAARGAVMSKLTCLRMLCDHPQLLHQSARNYTTTSDSGSVYAAELEAAGALDSLMASPKYETCCALLEEIWEANPAEKVVLFSFFKGVLRFFKGRYEGAVTFTGDMTALQRDTAKQRFMNDPECRLFLSSDAGGTGLDLPEARYLISYDLPWSAGKFDQRQARIIRLSSEWESVTLISLMMLGSIEERMFDMLQQKRAIADAIVDGKGIDTRGRLTLNLSTLTNFLQNSGV